MCATCLILGTCCHQHRSQQQQHQYCYFWSWIFDLVFWLATTVWLLHSKSWLNVAIILRLLKHTNLHTNAHSVLVERFGGALQWLIARRMHLALHFATTATAAAAFFLPPLSWHCLGLIRILGTCLTEPPICTECAVVGTNFILSQVPQVFTHIHIHTHKPKCINICKCICVRVNVSLVSNCSFTFDFCTSQSFNRHNAANVIRVFVFWNIIFS